MSLAQQATTTSRWGRLQAPLVTVGLLGLAAAALRLRDPHVAGSWGFCPLYALTGVYCPGCGGLRAVNDLTHGNLAAAAQSNLLLVLALPLVAAALLTWLRRGWTGRTGTPRWLVGNGAWVALAVVMLVFMVVRNLPGFAWLTPG